MDSSPHIHQVDIGPQHAVINSQSACVRYVRQYRAARVPRFSGSKEVVYDALIMYRIMPRQILHPDDNALACGVQFAKAQGVGWLFAAAVCLDSASNISDELDAAVLAERRCLKRVVPASSTRIAAAVRFPDKQAQPANWGLCTGAYWDPSSGTGAWIQRRRRRAISLRRQRRKRLRAREKLELERTRSVLIVRLMIYQPQICEPVRLTDASEMGQWQKAHPSLLVGTGESETQGRTVDPVKIAARLRPTQTAKQGIGKLQKQMVPLVAPYITAQLLE
ncbi:hypothetical protein P171DRAFT_481381 [Karstenula rhodostoma CBS 690.94]|uniref:Uncharacterized protein n=1 Tax=Karstenula rhodostoma CBS 690.94 TaxID=1392251 RepID=A0A9P4PQ33_9PLEO|nr:hypothetical protein P171DRAFT_481381 [Karstenula rhodostoma CBS 690.94]